MKFMQKAIATGAVAVPVSPSKSTNHSLIHSVNTNELFKSVSPQSSPQSSPHLSPGPSKVSSKPVYTVSNEWSMTSSEESAIQSLFRNHESAPSGFKQRKVVASFLPIITKQTSTTITKQTSTSNIPLQSTSRFSFKKNCFGEKGSVQTDDDFEEGKNSLEGVDEKETISETLQAFLDSNVSKKKTSTKAKSNISKKSYDRKAKNKAI